MIQHFDRRLWAATLLMAIVVAMATGCARRGGPFEEWIRAEDDRLWQETTSSAWVTQSANDALTEPADEFMADEGPERYVAIALERHPSVRAAEQRVAALAQRIPQVTSLDDPMLEIAPVGDMAETAAGMVGLMTGVSQRFPLGGKLDAAGNVAEAEVATAIADLEDIRLRVANDVRQAYWRFYQSARALEVIEENRTILEQLAQVADAQYRAGQATQQDVLRATVELSELDAAVATLEQAAGSAQSMLNQLIDRPVDAELPRPLPVAVAELELRLDGLLRTAMAENPALHAMSMEIEADRQRVRLARLQRVPDLNVSLSYNLVDDEGLSSVANGDDQWWLGFGINLPIWQDRLEAAEREARLNVLRKISTLAAEKNALAFRVRDAVLSAETAHRRAVLFRDEILPQARQTVDASLSGYRAGRVDFLTLASNWRRMLEFELMLHENVADLKRALAEIEREVGAAPAWSESTTVEDEPADNSKGDS